MIKILTALIQRLSRAFPNLGIKLKLANIHENPELFIKKSLIASLYISAGFTLFLFLVLSRLNVSLTFILSTFPILFGIVIFYLLRVPDVKIMRINRDINAEIIFKLVKKKRRLAEVPVRLTKRRYGVSKLDNKKEIKNHLVLLSRIFLWRVFG